MLIGRAAPPDGSCDDFGKPGGLGAAGRGSSGPTLILVGAAGFGGGVTGGALGGAGFAGAAAGGTGGGGALGLGTGIALGGATDGGGASGGATGAVATAAVPTGATGSDAGFDRVGGRKPPRGGRTRPPPWTPVRIDGVDGVDSGRVARMAAGVGRGRRRTGSSSSRGCGVGPSLRCPWNFSRTLTAVASSRALE